MTERNVAFPHDQRIEAVLETLSERQLAVIFRGLTGSEQKGFRSKKHGIKAVFDALQQQNGLIDLDALSQGQLVVVGAAMEAAVCSNDPYPSDGSETEFENSTSSDADPETSSEAAVSQDSALAASEEAPVRRKRGRPRKHPPVPTKPDVPRRRGRIRGVKSGEGVTETMIAAITAEALSIEEIVAILAQKFPGRPPEGMANTVRIQLRRYPKTHGGMVEIIDTEPPKYRYHPDKENWAPGETFPRPKETGYVDESE